MTRIRLLSILMLCISAGYARAAYFPAEACQYSISCHCSFIHETAAHATVQISCYDNTFNATLNGCSIPIFGTMYCINDTLQAKYEPSGQTVQPATEQVLYLSGYYRKPRTDDMTDAASPTAYRSIYGQGELSADASTMECVTLTADMLCMFYYAKTVDFGHMQQGIAQDIPIIMPYGDNRTLQVIYNGMSDYLGHSVYNLTANFTYYGSMSSYPITILIDPEIGVPVEFAANIDIGQVVMAYEY